MEKYITIQNSIVGLDFLGDGSFPEEQLLDINLKTHHYNELRMCGRQLDSHDQSKGNGPGTEVQQGGKPLVPSNG